MNDAVDQAHYASLRANVSALGALLGEVIASAEGDGLLQRVEQIRLLSRAARDGDESAGAELLDVLRSLEDDELVPVARAFSQFLNLSNIADQQHTISREMDPLFSASRALATAFSELLEEGSSREQLVEAIAELRIELVLTAHPAILR